MGGLSHENGEYVVADDDVEDGAGEEDDEQTAAEFRGDARAYAANLRAWNFSMRFSVSRVKGSLGTLGCLTRQSTE